MCAHACPRGWHGHAALAEETAFRLKQKMLALMGNIQRAASSATFAATFKREIKSDLLVSAKPAGKQIYW